MATVHMTEAEVARDLHSVLAKVRQGVEVVIEQDHQPVAVIRSPLAKGRLLSECIALAEARGTTAILDDGYMNDVAEGIEERSKPWNPQSWEQHNLRHFQKVPGLQFISL
jgi:antitoxin (DNA-binding transcriptional repressor) of toxin-antitoxin stability system